jgi:lysozyme
MKPRHQVSRDAVELIKRFEGYRRASAKLADGRWTIGYGHTKSAREGVEISEADAEALLLYDLAEVSAAVNRLTFTPLTQNQFDALCSFALNIGLENFRTSGVLRRINEGAMLQAAYAIEMWRKADFEGERIVVDALIRRRAAEKSLFLLPERGYVPAPTPILPPLIDYDAAIAQPRQLPLNLIVPMEGDLAQAMAEDIPGQEPSAPHSSAAAAIEAVTAKLQTLLPETEGDPAPLQADAPQDAFPEASRDEPAREMVEPISAPAVELPMADPGAGEADELIVPPPPAMAAAEMPEQPVVYAPQPEGVQVGPMGVVRPKKRRRMRLMPFAPILLLGIVFFFGGVAWQAVQKDNVGLAVALLGGLMASVALYYLLGQIDEESPKA